MRYFTPNGDTYNESIRKIETEDPVYAEFVNDIIQKLVNNGEFLKKAYEGLRDGTTDGNFSGKLAGNADTATKAEQDGDGNVIPDTYAKKAIYDNTAVSLGRKENTTSGERSVAIGYDVTASAHDAQAFGYITTASGSCSHAEGYYTTASGTYSHAEGRNARAENYAYVNSRL